jgi:uncharacterized protein (DUF1501 family)
MRSLFSRREFLRGSSAAALLAGAHVLGIAPARVARAAVADPVLVLLHLQGGNDALNTVIPLDNVGAPQRTRYQQLRPDLAIPTGLLGATALGADPALGTGLALHPALGGLKTLYDEGRLALVLGVGLEGSSLSHFQAEDAWWSGSGDALAANGWIGRHQDERFGDGQTRALSFGAEVHRSLAGSVSDVIGAHSIGEFELPDDGDWRYRDGDARAQVLASIYAEGRLGGPAESAARAGTMLLDKSALFGEIELDGWGSRNEAVGTPVGRALAQVASILRHDTADPARDSALRFFHLTAGGFDTHSRQGAAQASSGHGQLLGGISVALTNFQRDLEALGVAHRVVTLVYSEFGRRAAQNGAGAAAGTDHGRGGTLFLLGQPVLGGLYGRLPELGALDAHGNLSVEVDFRRVYASVIEDWLGGDASRTLPGGPFAKLPVFA